MTLYSRYTRALTNTEFSRSEAVLGDGKWGGSGTRWLDEMRAAVVLVLLGLPAAAWHSEKSHL